MSFAYNPPPRRRGATAQDAEDVDGIFDSITSAVDSVTKAVSAGSKVASSVGAAAAPILSAARRVAGQGGHSGQAQRPQARPAPMRPAPTPVRSTSSPLRAQRFAPLPTRALSATPQAPAPAASHAVPIAIGAVLVAAAGGGALWFFTRKDGGRAPHS